MAGIAALAIAYVLSHFCRSFLAVLAPVLTEEVGATNADLSVASGAWFAAFALMQFAVGVALDRYGPRRTASVLLTIAGGGGALLLANATSPFDITVAMTLIGIGFSPVLMAALYIFASSFSQRRFALFSSLFVSFGMAGNVVGASPLAYAVEIWGWRDVISVFAMAIFANGLAIYALIRDPVQAGTDTSESSGFSGYFELLRIRELWPIIPLIMTNYATVAGIRGLWAGPYLVEIHSAGSVVIGQATLWMALAMVAGTFFYGPVDTLLGKRKWLIFGGSLIALLAISALMAAPQMPLSLAVFSLVMIGLFGTGYVLLMALARSYYPPHLIGRGVTLMNFFSMGGVGLFQFLNGIIISTTVSLTPAGSYQILFGFQALMLLLTIVIFLWAREAPPQDD